MKIPPSYIERIKKPAKRCLTGSRILCKSFTLLYNIKYPKNKRKSIGFDFYATTVTLNGKPEIVKIHQDFDVA